MNVRVLPLHVLTGVKTYLEPTGAIATIQDKLQQLMVTALVRPN